MRISITITIFLVSACSSIPRPEYLVTETNRPDGTYGGWVTVEQTDPFASYTFSTAKGAAIRGGDFGDSAPRVVVQDDFVINIYSGDGYICSGQYSSIHLDYKLTKAGMPAEQGRSLWRVVDSNDHFQMITSYDRWQTQAWLHALNTFDLLYVQYTDECGEQKVLEFDISGSHHTKTSIVSPNTDVSLSEPTGADTLVSAGLIKKAENERQ